MNTEKLQSEIEKANKSLQNSKGEKLPPPPPPPSYTTSPCHDFSFTISNDPLLTFPPNSITCNEPSPSFEIDFSRSTPLGIMENKDKSKHKSSSFLLVLGKWWRGSQIEGKEVDRKTTTTTRKKKKKVFDVGRLLKKYVNMVEPLLFFKGHKDKRDSRGRPHSFSGHSDHKERDKWRKRRRQLSAPASMRTSPTNSGHLSATSVNLSSSSSDESTMEELQSAIQAAIAHCKKSTSQGGQV
ncbi:probable BRI1 kinase inhibitor 1 [Typha latifolia]|uniref:probable BRI1 kinase inhibitor 1 n=1 Tax=Typha latifolia TaxID=4733 RepID=UPI003C3035BB